MRASPHLPQDQLGFTLIELVIVIVILGVVSAMAAVFMRGPIDAYFAVARRAALTDLTDTVFRRLERDVHKALPNSVRTPNTAGANQCLEFIPTKTGGRYRADGTSSALTFNAADTLFNMLGQNSLLPNDQRIVAGDIISVYNLGPMVSGADAYNQDNTSVVTAVGTEFQNTTPYTGWETPLTIANKQFPLESGGSRFHVIPAAEHIVSYVCSGNKLYRTVNATSFTSACPASGSVIANNVSTCFFDYSGDDLSRNALLRIVLQVRDSSGNESVQMQQEIHVNNTP
ncbi:prepilin-type N-terminal cleavage/methylation domain-containing protein [Rhodoferax sp. GW822-FHT02A01]|uniref:prepilin-type N-terminal cleavage/methylation domain-containing protein n=1 Tax=Rhodoferax sp. GW822-FHT02A01 TaxID=3141537 RepID=UPI00315C6B59